MMKNQQEARELTVRQRMEAVGLLSVGTFLEYFDLMIYVHMAVVINELFFPKANPETTTLYAATASINVTTEYCAGGLVISVR
ncbi:MAG: hypothetical protein O7D30_04010 [Rickettsia endosymbiont of Ixodes persulcatus]|nr:hypothetical protein [Rickettsia endosymbiont of Ixodes persulcatus]MCZ6924611.1 hypothetical protein [Rickettsia endosymbiont of Ixodes persulcatus]